MSKRYSIVEGPPGLFYIPNFLSQINLFEIENLIKKYQPFLEPVHPNINHNKSVINFGYGQLPDRSKLIKKEELFLNY